MITTDSVLATIGADLKRKPLLRTLEVMAQARAMDEKMMKLVKQNKGGTFQLAATGHEMIGAVCASVLQPGTDWACGYYRDQPLAVGLGCDLVDLFGVFMGRKTVAHSRGRMMPYHFSDKKLRMPTQSSVVGTQFLPAVGIAHGIKMEGKREVVYVSGGDGSTSQGDFTEALNFAALHQLPIVFVIHDNGWAISVPVEEQVAGGSIAAAFAGRPCVAVHDVDGCDYVAMHQVMGAAVDKARNGEGPSLVVARVPRIASHSNSDNPQKYKTDACAAKEVERDPLPRFESYLLTQGIEQAQIDAIKQAAHRRIEEAAKQAAKMPFPTSESGGDNVYQEWEPAPTCEVPSGEKVVMIDAINHAIAEEMEINPGVVVFGEDVAHGKGGVFGATRALTEKFGNDRCFNTPLAEATIVGLALGLALDGVHTPVAEIQFAEYLWPGFNLLASEVSSIHYRSGGEWNVPLVLRMPYGGYIQGGPYHSQSIEGILAHVPGIKIVIPSNAADAKGLLKTAIRDPNPVIFLEHKALYRQAKFCARAEPSANYTIPFGKANIVREGQDLTFVGWGMMVVMAMDLAPKLAAEGIDMEVIDLRTIVPADIPTVVASVKKTGKLLVAHEAPLNGGFGAEIAARVAEEAFEYLDGPIARVCGLDCAIPYSKPLENAVLPQLEDLETGIRDLYNY